MGGQVYLAKGSLSNEPAERVIANRLELLGSEVADDGQWGGCRRLEGKETRVNILEEGLVRLRKLVRECQYPDLVFEGGISSSRCILPLPCAQASRASPLPPAWLLKGAPAEGQGPAP